MRKGLVFTLVALPLAFALPMLAALLPAPTVFVAQYVAAEDWIATSWIAVDGATKYSVDVIAVYNVDTNKDGVQDTLDFDFGTSDRDDDGSMSDPNLNIAISAMTLDLDGDGIDDRPVSAILRVKALSPGKGAGPQNNPFSAATDPPVEIPALIQ